MSVDGPALVAAAVRAAVLAKAPRRTVQAVAAAVVGVLVNPTTARATPNTGCKVPPGTQRAEDDDSGLDAETLLANLKSSRRAQRQRKKERRRAAKEEAAAFKTEPKVTVGHVSRSGSAPLSTTPNLPGVGMDVDATQDKDIESSTAVLRRSSGDNASLPGRGDDRHGSDHGDPMAAERDAELLMSLPARPRTDSAEAREMLGLGEYIMTSDEDDDGGGGC